MHYKLFHIKINNTTFQDNFEPEFFPCTVKLRNEFLKIRQDCEAKTTIFKIDISTMQFLNMKFD